jgi:hypothetical protein
VAGYETNVMNTQELARELGHPDAQELLRSRSGPRLQRTRWPPAGSPYRFPLERRTHRHLHGTDLPQGSGAFVPPECRTDDRYWQYAREGEGPSGAWPRRNGHRRRRPIAASTKSLEASKLAEFERHVRSVYKQMVRISIEPQWARFYDFGAGRVPAFLANLGNDG